MRRRVKDVDTGLPSHLTGFDARAWALDGRDDGYERWTAARHAWAAEHGIAHLLTFDGRPYLTETEWEAAYDLWSAERRAWAAERGLDTWEALGVPDVSGDCPFNPDDYCTPTTHKETSA